MDVWEADLLDVQNVSEFNDNYKYLLTVIDFFSKLLHVVPLKSKTGQTVASAFLEIQDRSDRRVGISICL